MENSEIEWTDHTFNPWIGCTKVSDGCKACYAESLAKRFNKAKWGPTAQRVQTDVVSYWQKPFTWNKKATAAGKRMKVFCASLADVFEDNVQVEDWRAALWPMIEATDMLDWLLLTKRPELVNGMVPARWQTLGRWPANVWLGTSVENQKQADKRIPELLKIPATVRFLSCEPLLGSVDLWEYTIPQYAEDDHRHEPWRNGVDWVIVGGESGPHARPMQPSWARAIRDNCVGSGTAFFFKQWGQWGPKPDYMQGAPMIKRSKFANGRELDGRTWDEYPEVTRAAR